jgi:putative membrane protein
VGGDLNAAGLLAVVIAVIAGAAYLGGAARLRRRGDAWPRRRQYLFLAGTVGLVIAVAFPPPVAEFTAHMIQHLVIGMAAPLLLVLGRPVTLALRVPPPGRIRDRALAVLHARPTAVLVWPPLAALLDAGGLWLLYRTRLFAAVDDRPWLHAAVHVHVFAAGLIFTASVCQLDPVRRRYPFSLRAATLVAVAAAHAVLAKSLWLAAPPDTGFATADVHAGAELMYYGGDLIEVALAAVLATGWYAATGRALLRTRRRAGGPPVRTAPPL